MDRYRCPHCNAILTQKKAYQMGTQRTIEYVCQNCDAQTNGTAIMESDGTDKFRIKFVPPAEPLNLEKFLYSISVDYNDAVFSYKGEKSGITSEVYNGVPTFQVWHGKKTKIYSSVAALIHDLFWEGKSLYTIFSDSLSSLDIWFL